VINSFCGPTFSRYMTTLSQRLTDLGLAQEPLIMSSSGGCVAMTTAGQQPLLALQSGPAGGIAGALEIGARLGDENIICTDMGGTSFDVGLIERGSAVKADEGVASRYPYALSLVDIDSIGSGGGSIASVTDGGSVQVGPRSAGAHPGPACYGRGGERPTVTDADLVLGFIRPDGFLGGRMTLDRAAAEQAIRKHVAEPLGIGVREAAHGIYTVVNAQMADFIRMKTIRSGYDPRQFTIFAFGGAGPVHAAMYSRDLGARAFVVPLGNTSSVFSAYGLTVTDVERVWEKSLRFQEPFDWPSCSAVFDELGKEAVAALTGDGFEATDIHLEHSVTMKYAGQIHALGVTVPQRTFDTSEFAPLQTEFDATYDRIFGPGAAFREAGSEIMGFSVKATVAIESQANVGAAAARESNGPGQTRASAREVCWNPGDGYTTTPVHWGPDLAAGTLIEGPAVIELPDTSVPVPPGAIAGASADGTLTIRTKESE
jgi:N-methylhydantoinase A